MSGCPFAAIIKETAPAVAPHVRAIVDDFYPRMFEQNPETKAFFNPANQFADPPKQRESLANAVVAYASNIDNLAALQGAVEVIANKHCGLSVLPEHYPIVHKNLMESIAETLGPEVVTEAVGTGWSDAVLALAKILSEREEQLMQAAEGRRGGWRGIKDFTLIQKREVSEGCMECTFEAADGAGPIDFTPGQFLTMHLRREGATPRHYTVTSKPGEPFLQCCVKRIEKGFVSNALHECAEGEVVGLAAPFGTFGFKDSPAVLISAGIGATPMKCFLSAYPERVKFALHVDKKEAAHPFKEQLAGVPHHFHYTEASGRPDLPALVKDVLQPHLEECDFFICGPSPFQDAMKAALKEAGAKGVYSEAFGPELAGA